MKKIIVIHLIAAIIILVTGPVFAMRVSGQVFCDANQTGILEMDEDTPIEGVTVRVSNPDGVVYERNTDASGSFYFSLPVVVGTYTETLEAGLPSDAIIIEPAGGVNQFTLDNVTWFNVQNWLIDSETCQQTGCWLTGGGVKFSSITNTRLAEFGTGNGPLHSFGGNVFPSCDPNPGDGGQWNHIAHDMKLHFQGNSIHTVTCGNLDPAVTDPGSESPVTPFNFIEFAGVGTLKGIKGNKADFGTVYFEARAEDRNEPGNENAAKDDGGATIDHYYLRVYNGDGQTLMVVEDGDLPGENDPIRITGGNLQLHISSCDNPQ